MTATPSPLPAPTASDVSSYPVFFIVERAQQKLTLARRNRRSRIFSLGLSLGILAAIYGFFRDQLGDVTWPILLISLGIPVTTLTWAVIKAVAARREAADVTDGLALGIGRDGLLARDGTVIAWPELDILSTRRRRFGRSAELSITTLDGRRAALPLEFLSVKPATLDGAVWALSGGRRRIDFGPLGV